VPRKLATGREFAKALEAAGIVTDLNTIERIVIDVPAHDLVRIHVQRVGDERLPSIAEMLAEPCCDLHGRNCEPEELCCKKCTEWDHPRHRGGSGCSNPILSGNGGM
jgi:hypothetical protein